MTTKPTEDEIHLENMRQVAAEFEMTSAAIAQYTQGQNHPPSAVRRAELDNAAAFIRKEIARASLGAKK